MCTTVPSFLPERGLMALCSVYYEYWHHLSKIMNKSLKSVMSKFKILLIISYIYSRLYKNIQNTMEFKLYTYSHLQLVSSVRPPSAHLCLHITSADIFDHPPMTHILYTVEFCTSHGEEVCTELYSFESKMYVLVIVFVIVYPYNFNVIF